MTMIYFKIILLLLLSIAPFIYANHLRKQNKKGEQKNSLYKLIGKHLPKLYSFCEIIKDFTEKVYEGMKRRDSFRRFFILVILLILLLYQYVDFHIASSLAHQIRLAYENNVENSVETIDELKPIFVYFTKPHATMLAGGLSLLFFVYKIPNIILTKLHNSNHLYCLIGLLTMTITILLPRWIILAETLAIILYAAYIYPNMRPAENPKGRKGLPESKQKKKLYLNAA